MICNLVFTDTLLNYEINTRMKSILSIRPVRRFYECNIDLSKPVQIQGVTNLSDMPILNVHSSVPYSGDGMMGTSALDGVLNRPQPTRQVVSNILDLNLI